MVLLLLLLLMLLQEQGGNVGIHPSGTLQGRELFEKGRILASANAASNTSTGRRRHELLPKQKINMKHKKA